jgi:hypothetical protein
VTPPEGDYFFFSNDVVRSRGILLDTLHALEAQRESLTVVGAHAVYERTKSLTSELEMDSTRDADIGVFPELLASAPLVGEVMSELGLEPASQDRPGVWGLKSEQGLDLRERLTVDLLAPDALAGGTGRRSADTGAHGTKIVSRTKGTELTLIDRDVLNLDSFGLGTPIDAHVAGLAALIAAKAWKLFDRLDPIELRRNAARLRPKDAGDLWRLLATSDPRIVRATFEEGKSNPRIGSAVTQAKLNLESLLADPAFVGLAISHFGGRFSDERIEAVATDWITDFTR